jgi:hypothetical protein
MTGVVDAKESTLLVPVPSAEDSVARFRKRLDPASRLGVPAHVSVLYPFAPPARLDDAAMERLSVIFEGVGAFDFELAHVGWFDERVLYLAPEPASTFVGITNALAAGFPDYPPYGGEFPEVIPHLTLGEGASAPRMRRAARRVQRHLPVRATAAEVWLMAPDGAGHWHTHHAFPLGPAGR